MSEQNAEPVPEFSRTIVVDKISASGVIKQITAKPEECMALAQRFDLEGLHALEAEIRLEKLAGGTLIRVEGTIRAHVVQRCVATLEPLPSNVNERFTVLFSTEAALPKNIDDLDLTLEAMPGLEDEDVPEPLDGNILDIGELAAQHLFLSLDPYARKADAVLKVGKNIEINGPEKENPFAKLAERRGND